jgi:6,7-dimethyl-8-ribityllumazine synthase
MPPKILEGKLDAKGLRFALLVSRFNHFITDRLLEGALDMLLRHNAREDDIEIMKVPGSFEIPLAAKKAAASGRYDAVVALGALIRGDTSHFEYISAEVIKGIAAINLESEIPIALGVLTTDTLEQAIERAGMKAGNKGGEAALSAIEMANLIRILSQKR